MFHNKEHVITPVERKLINYLQNNSQLKKNVSQLECILLKAHTLNVPDECDEEQTLITSAIITDDVETIIEKYRTLTCRLLSHLYPDGQIHAAQAHHYIKNMTAMWFLKGFWNKHGTYPPIINESQSGKKFPDFECLVFAATHGMTVNLLKKQRKGDRCVDCRRSNKELQKEGNDGARFDCPSC